MNGGGSHGGWSHDDEDEPPDTPSLDLPDADRYDRIDLLGVGGMGRVFDAFDKRLQRRVALKEVAPHLAGTAGAQRLATEALLTADLEHPGIVSLHDAGRTDDGRLYYTMRLVRGRSLAGRLVDVDGPEERLALVRHVLDACHAVGYAHSRGIVHRDLKPANIMIGEFGETQVMDWGLARRLCDGELVGSSAGTEGYISPEAAAGRPTDARSDVWSLGATLREVVGPGAAPDLAAVVRRALEPEPERRYLDAHELAVDLEHFLDGRRVGAYDYSPLELLKRLAAAWRAPLAVAVIAAAVLAFVGTTSWVRTSQARNRAVDAELQTRAALEQSDLNLASSLEAQAAAAVREGRFPDAQVLAAHALLHRESPVARGVLVGGGSAQRPAAVRVEALPSCDGVALAGDDVFCRLGDGFEVWDGGGDRRWGGAGAVHDAVAAGEFVVLSVPTFRLEVRARATGELVATLDGMPGDHGIVATADGTAVGIANGPTLTVVSLPDLERWDAQPCGADGIAAALALTADRAFVSCRGTRLVSLARGEAPRVLRRYDGDRPEPRLLAYADGVLYGGTARGRLFAVDAETGGLLAAAQVLDGPLDHLVPLRGTRLVAVSGDRGGVRLWDLDGGVEVMRLPAPTRAVAAAGPDQLLVAGSELRRWDLPSSLRPLRLQAPAGLSSVITSPDGRFVAGARGDGAVTVWSAADGRVLAELRWQERVVKWAAFTPTGDRLLATALGEASVRSWSTEDWQPAESWVGGPFRRIGALVGGQVWGVTYGKVLLADVRDGRSFAAGAVLFDGATDPSGTGAVLLDDGGGVWRLRSGESEPEALFRRPGSRSIAVDGAGRIALAREDHVELVEPTGATVWRFEAEAGGVIDVALSPDGRWLAAGLMDGTALLWSTRDGRLVAALVGHRERVASVHFTADSETLTTGDWAGTVLRWSLSEVERPAEQLVAEVEATWRLTLEQTLAAGL